MVFGASSSSATKSRNSSTAYLVPLKVYFNCHFLALSIIEDKNICPLPELGLGMGVLLIAARMKSHSSIRKAIVAHMARATYTYVAVKYIGQFLLDIPHSYFLCRSAKNLFE